MKFIIFGCGKKGKELFEILGSDNVIGFIDNNPDLNLLIQTKIIDIKQLDSIHEDYTVLIAASGNNERQIVQELESFNIFRYLTYSECLDALGDTGHRNIRDIISSQIVLHNMQRHLKSCDSQVEFYLVDSFEIYHYLPIYKALIEAGVKTTIVAEPGFRNTAGQWFDFDRAIRILDDYPVSYSFEANPDADVAITTQFAENLEKYDGIKISLPYGNGMCVSKDFQSDPKVAEKFDICLVQGDYKYNKVNKFLQSDRIIKIGYPKYIDFFQNKPEEKLVRKELHINTEKPVLLYLPTWDEYCSIQEYSDAISELKSFFYVVSKPHHCTYRLMDRRKDLDKLYDISDLVINPDYSTANLSLISDFVICDAKSGVCCEIPYFNRKIKMAVIYAGNLTPNDMYPEFGNMFRGIYKPEELTDVVEDTYKADGRLEFRSKMVDFIFDKDSSADLNKFVDYIKSIVSSIRRNGQ